MHRGARRAPIFLHDADCEMLLDLIGEAVQRYRLEVHAYALMPNHYHLLVRSVRAKLSDAMRHINGRFTRRLNHKYHWDGPVFRGRFRSQLVQDDLSLPYLLAYIHLNPLRANLVTRLEADCWSSHLGYLRKSEALGWLTRTYFLEHFGTGRKLHAYVLSLHQGKRRWPEALQLDSGWWVDEETAVDEEQTGAPPDVPLEEVLRMIRAVTGSSDRQLKEVAMGRGANPARRFAVWAVVRRGGASHWQAATLLGMSRAQVANVLQRLDLSREPFRSWRDEWTAAEAGGMK